MWICPECRSVYRAEADTCERDGQPLAQVFAHQTRARFPLLSKVVGDRYRLIGGLGQGGLGTVYLAEHQHLGQLFAIKFLELGGTEDDSKQVKQDRERHRRDFLKEARVASLIRHPAVVGVSDFGEFEGMPFLVMDYVPGRSLLQEMERKGRFSVREGLDIARRIAEALEAFHERRLVHRDLKPANVILDPREDGRLTLVDLGLVKDLAGPGGKDSTHPLALRGTPGYLAPEQVPGWVLQGAGIRSNATKQPVNPRVDIYALGVILYEMLAGEPPYPDGTNTQVIVYACTREPRPLHKLLAPVDYVVAADPPVGLEKLVLETMAREPATRPETASAFIQRLDEVTRLIDAEDRAALEPPPRNPNSLDPGVAAASMNAVLGPGGLGPGVLNPADETATADMPADDSMGSEYETMVYDAGSRDIMPGAVASFDGHDPTVAEAASVPPQRSPNTVSRRKSRGGLWLGLIGALAAGALGAWWATRPTEGETKPPAVKQVKVGEKAPVAMPVGELPELAAAPAVADAAVKPPPAPDAGAAEVEPDQGAGEAPRPTAGRRARRARRRGRPRAPVPPTPTPALPPSADGSLDALLAQGNTAYQQEKFALALSRYRRFLKEAPQGHAQRAVIQQRVNTLKKITANQ